MLTAEQETALAILANTRVGVLLGPPGAGKSFLVSSLIARAPPDTVFIQVRPPPAARPASARVDPASCSWCQCGRRQAMASGPLQPVSLR